MNKKEIERKKQEVKERKQRIKNGNGEREERDTKEKRWREIE